MVKQKSYKLAINKIYPTEIKKDDIKYISLPYFGKASQKIANIIQKSKTYKVAFRTNSNIFKYLFNAKDQTHDIMKSGIYKLNCSFCNSVYIGQTIRNFDIRYKEHVRSYKNKHIDKSNYAKHLIENNHPMTSQNNIKFLHFCNIKSKIDVLEAFEIYKHNHVFGVPLMNEQVDLIDSPLLRVLDCNNNNNI